MTRLWVIALVGFSFGAVGCVSDDAQSLFVWGHRAGLTEASCDLSVSTDGLFSDEGTLNLDVDTSYTGLPVLIYQVRERSNDQSLVAESTWAHLRRMTVEIRDVQGSVVSFEGLPNPYTSVPLNLPLAPASGGADNSVAAFSVPLMPSEYGAQIRDSMGINDRRQFAFHSTFRGETLGRVQLKSDEWVHTVTMGRGSFRIDCAEALEASQLTCSDLGGQDGPIERIPGLCP